MSGGYQGGCKRLQRASLSPAPVHPAFVSCVSCVCVSDHKRSTTSKYFVQKSEPAVSLQMLHCISTAPGGLLKALLSGRRAAGQSLHTRGIEAQRDKNANLLCHVVQNVTCHTYFVDFWRAVHKYAT